MLQQRRLKQQPERLQFPAEPSSATDNRRHDQQRVPALLQQNRQQPAPIFKYGNGHEAPIFVPEGEQYQWQAKRKLLAILR